jgi:hypothetical protein
MTAASPKTAHTIGVKHALIGNENEILDQRLRDQHAVERIAVRTRQRACGLPMSDRNRETHKPLAFHCLGNVVDDGARAGELAQAMFGRDFPGRGGAEEDWVSL